MSTNRPFRRRYVYDAAGQLVAAEDDAGWRIEYEYDSNGNRIRRTVTAAGDNPAGGARPGERA